MKLTCNQYLPKKKINLRFVITRPAVQFHPLTPHKAMGYSLGCIPFFIMASTVARI